MAQPIQAVQIYFEHPFGAEREVLREFFSFVGCLVKTTMMPVETMLEKHKLLVNPESERITHLFLTDQPPEGIVLSKNEMWCSFRILKRELTINGKAILRNADQKISAEQFEKAALDVIIRRIWKDEGAETKSLLYINAAFWQLDMFEFLQIKSTFQALKMGELMALPMRGHYYLPEAVYLNKMADAFINMAKQCSVGPDSIYAVYAYVNVQRHLRELLTLLEAHAPLRTKLYAAVEPVQKLLSELNKIYRIEPNFVSMYCLAAALCEGQAQFALDARPYLSFRFLYWEEHKLLGIVMMPPESVNEKWPLSMYFQNSCDQDYPFFEWKEGNIPFFANAAAKAENYTAEEIRAKVDYEIEDENLEYYRRSTCYNDIFEELALESWLYNHCTDVPFVTFALQGIQNEAERYQYLQWLKTELIGMGVC